MIAGGAMSDEYALQHAPFEACQRSAFFVVCAFVEQSIIIPWPGNVWRNGFSLVRWCCQNVSGGVASKFIQRTFATSLASPLTRVLPEPSTAPCAHASQRTTAALSSPCDANATFSDAVQPSILPSPEQLRLTGGLAS